MNLDNISELAVARINRDMEENIGCYKRSIKSTRDRAKQRIKNVVKRVQTVKTLYVAGIIEIENGEEPNTILARLASGASYYDEYDVTGKIGKLRTLYNSEFVELDETTKQEYSSKDNQVKVFLKMSKDYCGPSLYVIITLDENSGCKYETTTYTSTNLVCSR